MKENYAKAVSFVFHPLLLPTYATLTIIFANPYLFANFSLKDKMLWVILVFVLTFVFPAVWLVMMKKLDLIQSLELRTSRERIVPFIATATFYLWAYRMFKPGYSHFQFANELIAYMLLGATLSVFLAFIINIFSKVSLHAVGMGNYFALSVLLATVSDINLSLLVVGAVLLAGVVGTARLILRAHALHEVYTGYMIGFTGLFLGFYVFPHSKWLRFL